MGSTPSMRLGLIGDNIQRSKSPLLHRLAGELCGLDIRYDILIPAEMGMSFDDVFEQCRRSGYRGINVTYPYKEEVVSLLRVDDPRVAAIGACNTVLFEETGPFGFNTDYSGFATAYRATFAGRQPGIVAMAGAGGVGKAVGFALASLGASALRLFDRDRPRAETLAHALTRAVSNVEVSITGTIEQAVTGADGLVNCTPLGMIGQPGSAIPKRLLGSQRWAFDAVYTPVETEFLADVRRCGVEIMSGYELFFYQGLDAFRLFTGRPIDRPELRKMLTQAE
jgi:shikimate dehydrogenase